MIGAYADNRLVGIARGLTDFSYCCYLSDLAVAKAYQDRGIGRELIARVKERIGEQANALAAFGPRSHGVLPENWFRAGTQRMDRQAKKLRGSSCRRLAE